MDIPRGGWGPDSEQVYARTVEGVDSADSSRSRMLTSKTTTRMSNATSNGLALGAFRDLDAADENPSRVNGNKGCLVYLSHIKPSAIVGMTR